MAAENTKTPNPRSRTILFGKLTQGKAVRQWPVAVFNNEAAAKQYAMILRFAYRAGDQEGIRSLDENAARDEAGKAFPETKWSVVTVPYGPTSSLGDDDDATEAPSAN